MKPHFVAEFTINNTLSLYSDNETVFPSPSFTSKSYIDMFHASFEISLTLNIFKVCLKISNNLNLWNEKYNQHDKTRKIVKTSIIGIVVNLILVAFKAVIGVLTNSIAITLDAVNNLTDALSSIITIIGAKLAGRPLIRHIPTDTAVSNISHQ